MINVNLLPAKQKDEITKQRFKLFTSSILYLLASILVVIAVVMFFITKVSQKSKIEDLQAETDKALIKLQAEPEIDKLLTIQNQLTSIPQLHDEKAVAARLFEYLDKIVPTDVTLTNVEVGFAAGQNTVASGGISNSNKVVLNGITRDFKSVNTFVDILKNAEFIAKTSANSATGQAAIESEQTKAFIDVRSDGSNPEDQVTLTFAISFDYNPQLFDFTVNQIIFSVPSKITSVSEQERPTGLFIDDPFDDDEDQRGDL